MIQAKWEKNEQEVFQLLKQKFPNAVLNGGRDSTVSDVDTGEGFFIDIKSISCQCGQSTDPNVIEEMKLNPRQWVADYYAKKNVKYWATQLGGRLILTAPADDQWHIEMEPVRNKRSGSRALAKKWLSLAEKTIGVPIESSGSKFFVNGEFKNRQLFETPDITFLLSECGNDYFEVRIRSNTATATGICAAKYRGLA